MTRRIMTRHRIDILLDNFAEFIEDELSAIESKAFQAGYDQGYTKGVSHGVQQIILSDIEIEYEAYNQKVSETDTFADIQHLED